MRIVSGKLGGRIFESPAGNKTHPMAERVRGGIFNALGDISGLAVLDAYAGSGALGFEALSRGAASAVAIESDTSAQRAIKENARILGITAQHKLVTASVSGWLSTTADASDASDFAIIFADPPYDALKLEEIGKLAIRTKPDGIFVLSWPGKQSIPELPGMAIAKQKSYGDAQIVYYQPDRSGS